MLMLKDTGKKMYFSTFYKAKKTKQIPFSGVIILAKWGSLSGPSLSSALFFQKNVLKPCYIVLLTNSVKKTNLAQIMTPEMAKHGPDNNTTAHIYIYTHIHTGCLAGIGTIGLKRFLIQPNSCILLFGRTRNHVKNPV